MDQSALESFIAVIEEASFSRAAEKIHITQPAISKRIANLERQLNTQLIDRIGKTAKPTRSGEVFFQHARKIMESLVECKVAISNLQHEVSGKLDLGISHHIGLHRLPLTLKTFVRKYPQVEINLDFIDSQGAYEKVLNGKLELALATLTQSPHAYICEKPIWDDPLCFTVSGDHPLAQLNDRQLLSIRDIIKYTALLPVKSDNSTRTIIDNIIQKEKHHIPHTIEANSLESIRMMTTIGLGWSILPRTMLTKKLRGLSLDIKPPARTLGVLYHESRTLSNSARAFLQILKNCNP